MLSIILLIASFYTASRIFTVFYILVGIIFIFSTISYYAQEALADIQAKALDRVDKDDDRDKKHVRY